MADTDTDTYFPLICNVKNLQNSKRITSN